MNLITLVGIISLKYSKFSNMTLVIGYINMSANLCGAINATQRICKAIGKVLSYFLLNQPYLLTF